MKLKLSNCDKVAVISDEDAELAQYTWSLGAHGYPHAWIPDLGETRPLHQLIMLRQGIASTSKTPIEHLNGNPLDNRRNNLRRTTQTENMLRAKGGGVRWHKKHKLWQVRLTYQYTEIHVGYYSDESLARAIALVARDQLLQLIATHENLNPSVVKSYFRKGN